MSFIMKKKILFGLLALMMCVLLTGCGKENTNSENEVKNNQGKENTQTTTTDSNENTPGLLLIDLDNFKKANDQYGHIVGDNVLKELTQALEEVVGIAGFIVRLGGDEFGVVLEDTNKQDMESKAMAILHKIRQLKHQLSINDVWTHLSVSIGGAISTNPQELEIDLFIRADEALYNSKDEGKDRFTLAKD